MSIDEAARATRRYMAHDEFTWGESSVVLDDATDNGKLVEKFTSDEQAQAACDRLNLIAVLEAIMEPSERMVMAADRASYIWQEAFEPKDAWLSMLAEKISEVKEQQNA